MATARERLMQLTLAQQEAQEFAQRGREAAQPVGGGILQRPIRPSEARGIDVKEGTPFRDFAEDFLNTIGITTARQRRAQVETLAGIDEANTAMLSAAREKMSIVASRGVGGINADRFREVNAQLESAEKLLDNPVPEIQEFGRQQIQSVATSLDQITADQTQFLDAQRDRIQGRLDNLVDLGREEQRLNDDVVAILNERGKRNGVNSRLSSFEKQVVANYLNGSSFAQTQGEGSLIPGFTVAFDPTEELTVGNATALIESVKRSRNMTIAQHLAQENKTATETGFRLNDKDGRLTVNEIVVPELGPEIENLRFELPRGEPLNIQPGLPTEQDARRSSEARANSFFGFIDTIGQIGREATPFADPVRRGAADIFEFFGGRERNTRRAGEGRGATGIIPIERETN